MRTAFNDGLIVDNFAGGGGASTGIEKALGRAIDIAINHDPEAIAMHEINHPGTHHVINNIWQIDPRDVTKGEHVKLAWFSPDCKHHSKAKGGKPREKSIRDLAWVVVLWAEKVKPDVILLENVEEFRTWGPLCDNGFPIKERAGETFNKWKSALRRAGYKLEHRELRACDYGAPTTRKRLFLIARSDGKKIVWPKPTHGKPGTPAVLSGKLLPFRTAADIIDWSLPCPSIFDRKKPLAEKTLRRIAHGIMRFVVNNPKPFIIPITHSGGETRAHSLDEPVRTVTTANRGELAVIAPHVTKFRSGSVGHAADEPLHTITANSFVKRPGGSTPLGVVAATMVQTGYGERDGQAPRALDVEAPLGTVVAGAAKHAAVAAFLQKFAENGKGVSPDDPLHTIMAGAPRHAAVCAHLAQFNTNPGGQVNPGHSAEEPVSTIATRGPHQAVVASNIVKLKGTSKDGQAVDEPLHTIQAGGLHYAQVCAFLVKYYGTSTDGQPVEEALDAITTKARFGLITVWLDGEEWAITDIGMRMLTPRELFNAQGFPPEYIIEFDYNGKPLTKTAQIRMCGNSVSPVMSEALARAQFPDEYVEEPERIAA